MAFERACTLADLLGPEEALSVTVGDIQVAIVWSNGDAYAVEDICSHAAVALSEGEVTGCEIECWLHGSKFDLRTGKPVGLPATEPVATFPIKFEGDDVLVDITTTLNGVTPQ